MNKTIGVIIPFYNGESFIDKCILSVFTLKHVDTEIYVVDNSDRDTNIESILKKYSNVTIIRSKSNVGYGKASNVGIKKAFSNKCRYVLVINQDIILDELSVSALITAIDTEDDIWMAGPMQYDYDKKKLDPIFLRWYLCDVENLQADAFNNNVRKYYHAKRIPGACLLIKKDMVDSVGAFDENYFMYSEDDDLCRKVIYAGKKIVLVPSARIAHYHSNVMVEKRDREQIAKMQRKSSAIYLLKDTNSNFLLNFIKLKKNDMVDYINSFLSLKILVMLKKLYVDVTLLMQIFPIYKSWKQEKETVVRIRNIQKQSTLTVSQE